MGRLLDIADRSVERRSVQSPAEKQMIALAVHETIHKLTDTAFLRSLNLLFEKHPGPDIARVAIHTLDGDVEYFDWDVRASDDLRTTLDSMLAERESAMPEGVQVILERLNA
jgi:hypothetical protein